MNVYLFFKVKYTLYRDRPIEERRSKFYSSCREGHVEIVSSIYIIYAINFKWEYSTYTCFTKSKLNAQLFFQTYPSSGLALLLTLTPTNHHKNQRNSTSNSKNFSDFSSERDKVYFIFCIIIEHSFCRESKTIKGDENMISDSPNLC